MVGGLNPGSIPAWVTLAVLLVISWRMTRGGAGSAVSELSKANEFLTHRVKELGEEVAALRVANAQLKEQTNVEIVIAKHEERATARADAMLRVLDLIAERLGPDDPQPHPIARESQNG